MMPIKVLDDKRSIMYQCLQKNNEHNKLQYATIKQRRTANKGKYTHW